VLFSFSGTVSDSQVVKAAKEFTKLTLRQQAIFFLSLSQEKEIAREAATRPYVKPIIIKPTKREEVFPYLSDIETIVYVCSRSGIGSVRMKSAFRKYSDRQIRRILARAYEKVATHDGR
jgi:hypothetical protein